MKRLIILLILFKTTFLSICCTPTPESFCISSNFFINHHVFYGEIVQKDSIKLKLRIIDVLRGVELRDTITIWNDTDMDCFGSGTIPMNVSGMGSIGDTIITILHKIETLVNSWDIINDYRRPEWFEWSCTVPVINDTVNKVSYSTDNNSFCCNRVSYNDFKQIWFDNRNSCYVDNSVDTRLYEKTSISPNPFTSSFIMKSSYQEHTTIVLYDILGKQIEAPYIIRNGVIEVDGSKLESGVYLVVLLSEEGEVISRNRVVKR